MEKRKTIQEIIINYRIDGYIIKLINPYKKQLHECRWWELIRKYRINKKIKYYKGVISLLLSLKD
jgi:hypothetical protein